MAWPPLLRKLSFGVRFNQPIAGVSWPGFVQEIAFSGDVYAASVSKHAKSSVQTQEYLQLVSHFNQPITEVRWPPSLVKLTFGDCNDQSVDGVAWPASLRELHFSRDFSLPRSSFEWPAFLEN